MMKRGTYSANECSTAESGGKVYGIIKGSLSWAEPSQPPDTLQSTLFLLGSKRASLMQHMTIGTMSWAYGQSNDIDYAHDGESQGEESRESLSVALIVSVNTGPDIEARI